MENIGYLIPPAALAAMMYYIELIRKKSTEKHNTYTSIVFGLVGCTIFLTAFNSSASYGLSISYLLSSVVIALWAIISVYKAEKIPIKTFLENSSMKGFISFCAFLMVGVLVDSNVDTKDEILSISIGSILVITTWLFGHKLK